VTALPEELQSGGRQARACLVQLEGTRFAVEVRFAREVVVFDEVTMVPLAPPHLLGVVSLRGSVMPLVDIRPVLGLEATRAVRESRALVVEHASTQAALLIDEVDGLEALDGLAPAGEDADGRAQDFSAGRLERPDGTVALLDVGRILSSLGGQGEAGEEAH